MKRQQYLVAGTGVLLLLVLFFFGQTVPPHQKANAATTGVQGNSPVKSIGLQEILQDARAGLTPAQLSYVNRLEHSVVRGDVRDQQANAYHQLADFWKDSVQNGLLLYAYYTGEAGKLEKSQTNLTFAAQILLEGLQQQDNPALKSWMATDAKELFEKALELDPNNDSSKVGLGATYIFGAEAGNPMEVMQGIQRILEVARRDSTNMYAQLMLGWGGLESGQLDKAVERLTNVIRHQPGNIEAILLLAEVEQRKGDKAESVRWYQAAKKQLDPRQTEMIREIDQRINSLR